MTFYGRNVALEALNSTYYVPDVLYIQKDINKDEKITTIIDRAKNLGTKISYISQKELNKMADSKEHQGICVEVSNFHVKSKLPKELVNENDTYLYISDITYEHNIGAIMRSAEVSGIQGVIIPKNTKITPLVARTSVGAIFHVPIYSAPIFNTVKHMKKLGFEIVGIERDGEKLFESDLSGPTFFIIGGEDKELSTTLREKCDKIVEIPQFGKVNSLNMSVATSIVLFEKVRQIN